MSESRFDTVRLPVCWSEHADQAPPYSIDSEFAAGVDWAIDVASEHGLQVALDMHHYHELQRAPREHEERFVALWAQVAARYADRSSNLSFELLNEPRHEITAGVWNSLLRKALAVVRASNPTRVVIVGSAQMNDVHALAELDLPADHNLVATIHYYSPLSFTHQGAWWVDDADQWLGTTWGSGDDQSVVRHDLTLAAAWAEERGCPVFLGEFGTYELADEDSRVRWTVFVRSEAERLGLSWCYWDFATDFGAFDPDLEAWRTPLLRALIK